jgi:lysozyme
MIERMKMASLSLSASALISIAMHEGYKSEAYIPVPGDVPTIGFGTTNNVKMGDKITPERALIKLLNDTNEFEQAVKRCVGDIPLTAYEYSAYVSLTYNIGSGAFCKSSIIPKLKAYDYDGACKTILLYNNFKGKPLSGLTKRRQEEYRMCTNG